MMNRYLRYSALILIYLLLCSKGCDDRAQDGEEQAAGQTDSIVSLFVSDSILPAFIHGYEETAKQKIRDFGDYLVMLTDTHSPRPFREKAGKVLTGLFLPGKSVVIDMLKDHQHPVKIPVADFSNGSQGVIHLPGHIPADSITVVQPLHKVSDSLYAGMIRFAVIRDSLPETVLVSRGRTSGTVSFFAARRNIIYGPDSVRVWRVFLGDMEIR